MVEKFRQILVKILNEKGDINLFAILKMDEFTDRWTVLLSAPWIVESSLNIGTSFYFSVPLSTVSAE